MNQTEDKTAADTLRILFLGDVVGEPGRKAVTAMLPVLKEELSIDFIIVNGENAAGGRGITPKIAISLMRAGAAVITTGEAPDMPAFGARMSAEEILAIAHHIETNFRPR